MTESNGFFRKLVLTALIPTAVALVTFGALEARVSNLEAQLDGKASRETIQLQYQDIQRRLERIEQKLDAHPP